MVHAKQIEARPVRSARPQPRPRPIAAIAASAAPIPEKAEKATPARRPLPCVAPVVTPSSAPLAQLRGYRRDDLFTIAEIAYHYLMSGGLKLAHVLFDGLAAIAPDEAYFALALGLTYDRMNDRDLALEHYRRAAELDTGDGRPDINIAELYLDAGELERAKHYLARGTAKANARGDVALADKGRAILNHLAGAR